MSSIDLTVVSGTPLYLGVTVSDSMSLNVSSGQTTNLTVVPSGAIALAINSGTTTNITVSPVGVQGASGPITGSPTFIQSGAPTTEQYAGYTKYAWFDTSGGNLTLWIEDGV